MWQRCCAHVQIAGGWIRRLGWVLLPAFVAQQPVVWRKCRRSSIPHGCAVLHTSATLFHKHATPLQPRRGKPLHCVGKRALPIQNQSKRRYCHTTISRYKTVRRRNDKTTCGPAMR
eukprot:224473-Pyramimonas_sp.AAC.1